jgi:hypothetical protein
MYNYICLIFIAFVYRLFGVGFVVGGRKLAVFVNQPRKLAVFVNQPRTLYPIRARENSNTTALETYSR